MASTFPSDGNRIQGDWLAMKVSDERFAGDHRISHRLTGACEWRWSGGKADTVPPLEWKFNDRGLAGGSRGRRGVAGGGATVSARKLAASLWQLAVTTDCSGDFSWQCGLSDGLRFQFCSAPTISKSSREGVTKWDYGDSRVSGNVNHFRGHGRLPEYQEREIISAAPPKKYGSFKEQKCTNELKAEEGLSRTNLKHCTKKLDEEVALRMTMEHQQICAKVQELKDDVRRARKNCKKMYTLYSKLLHDLAEAKSSARKFMQNYEKEKKARELLEDVCIEQAKELEANKAEIEELRIQCAGIQEEAAEDRRMLQMAEAWREERAQMKLVDAKLILEDKYSQMNNIIADLKALLRSCNSTEDVNEMSNVKVLERAFDRYIQGIQEILYMLPKSDEELTSLNPEASDSCASEEMSGKETMSPVDNVANLEQIPMIFPECH